MLQPSLSKIARQPRPQGVRRRADFSEVVPWEAGKQHGVIPFTNRFQPRNMRMWPATNETREFVQSEFERELASETRGQRGVQVKPLDGRNNMDHLSNTWNGSVQERTTRDQPDQDCRASSINGRNTSLSAEPRSTPLLPELNLWWHLGIHERSPAIRVDHLPCYPAGLLGT